MTVIYFVLHAIQLLVLCPIYLEAQITLPVFGNLTFVSNGSDVTLPWTFDFGSAIVAVVEWKYSKTGELSSFRSLAAIIGTGEPKVFNDTFAGISVIKPATLVLKNVNLDNNGTYRIEISLIGSDPDPPPSDILVVVLVQPVANIACSGTTNRDFQCVCKSKENVGNPPPLAYWYSNSGQIGHFGYLENNLYINNITRGESGTYMCKVKSHNLTDSQNITFEKPEIMSFTADKDVAINEPFTLTCKAKGTLPTTYWIMFNGSYLDDSQSGVKETIVTNYGVRTYKCIASNIIGNPSKELSLNIAAKPTIVFFQINRAENIATFGQKVTIICVAHSTLPLEYIILFNGMKLTGVVSGVKTVHTVNYSDAGRYECLAKNNLGNVSESLYLNVTDDFRNSMTSPTKVISSYSNATEKWYLFIVVSISGVCIGMLFLYAMQRLCHKLKNKNRDSTASGTCAIPGTYPGEAGNISSYQELNLRERDDREHYQSLRVNSRSPKNNEAKGEDQAGYQELNIVRQNIDNNYQSLNRV